MILSKKHLSRRTLLRGLGTTLALPLLDSMVPAFADTKTMAAKPVRLGFVYVPNGMIMDRWTPNADGASFEFTPTMKALEPFRDRMVVLSNLAQINGRALGDGPGDHARAGATWLTGVHPKKTEGADIHAGVSADQIAAKELGKTTQFGSLELGLEMPTLAGGCDSGFDGGAFAGCEPAAAAVGGMASYLGSRDAPRPSEAGFASQPGSMIMAPN